VSSQYIVKWGNILQDNYNYGATISFEQNGAVTYSAPLMPPSLCIKSWYSQRNFQLSRNTPYLPILEPNKKYQLQVQLELSETSAIQVKILFFDRYNTMVEELFFSQLTEAFTFPEKAVHYEIQLINKHHQQIIFYQLVITELDLYELYEQQDRRKTDLWYYPNRLSQTSHIQLIFLLKKNQVQHLHFTTHSDYLFCLIDPEKELDMLALSKAIYTILVKKNLRELTFSITKDIGYYNLPSVVYAIPRIMNFLLGNKMVTEPREVQGLAHLDQKLDEMQVSIQVLQYFLLENSKGK